MVRKREKLEIACTSTDCDNGLHCFKATKQMVIEERSGICRECGANLIDWTRVHRRDLSDVKNTFAALKLERVRHFFWHYNIGEKAINHARRKGKLELKKRVQLHLSKSIGPAHPFRDGAQTSMAKDATTIIPYAQHATASCCRKCLEYWHAIPQGIPLEETHLNYLTELVWLFIEDRIPNLTVEGEYIPRKVAKEQSR